MKMPSLIIIIIFLFTTRLAAVFTSQHFKIQNFRNYSRILINQFKFNSIAFKFQEFFSKDEVLVTTPLGHIKGRILHLYNRNVYFFNSIRFGEPPVGDYRFRKPRPVKYFFNGFYDATHNRPTCYQQLIPSLPLIEQSEDCLFLNIWSPDLRQNARLPVMFWITGGAFIWSGGNQIFTILYQGKHLALERVVIVVPNYRLWHLGWLYDGTDEAPGNQAMFDQVLALQWVQNYIAYFGGDPNQVTIFGQSAGAYSVGLHLISPLSRNLFRRAIMESGGPYFFFAGTNDNAHALETAKKVAAVNWCFGPNWIKCLKKVHPRRLMGVLPTLPELPWPIAVNNEFLPNDIVKMTNSNGVNNHKDVIAGVVESEGSIFVVQLLLLFPDILISPTFMMAQVKLVKLIVQLHWRPKFFPSADELFNEYFGDLSIKQWLDKDLVKLRYADLIGDFLLTCTMYLHLKDYKRNAPDSTVRFYILAHRPKIPYFLLCWANWTKTCHGDDIPFVFNYPMLMPKVYTDANFQVSLMIKYFWTNFAKTGDPFSSRPPKELTIEGFDRWPMIDWVQYQGRGQVKALNLNEQRLEYATDPWTRCDTFWSKYFYHNSNS